MKIPEGIAHRADLVEAYMHGRTEAKLRFARQSLESILAFAENGRGLRMHDIRRLAEEGLKDSAADL